MPTPSSPPPPRRHAVPARPCRPCTPLPNPEAAAHDAPVTPARRAATGRPVDVVDAVRVDAVGAGGAERAVGPGAAQHGRAAEVALAVDAAETPLPFRARGAHRAAAVGACLVAVLDAVRAGRR